MKISSAVIAVVQGLRGPALEKARATRLYDKIAPPEEAVARRVGASAFADMEDDLPWEPGSEG